MCDTSGYGISYTGLSLKTKNKSQLEKKKRNQVTNNTLMWKLQVFKTGCYLKSEFLTPAVRCYAFRDIVLACLGSSCPLTRKGHCISIQSYSECSHGEDTWWCLFSFNLSPVRSLIDILVFTPVFCPALFIFGPLLALFWTLRLVCDLLYLADDLVGRQPAPA